MNIIAIDCGASFIKAAFFEDKKLVKQLKQEAPLGNNQDIFDVSKIVGLEKMVRDIVAELSEDIDEAVISISNEMHGFILAYPDGTPYTGYISWQTELADKDEIWKYLNFELGEKNAAETIRQTGMPIRSGLPSSNLFWMRENGKLPDEQLFFYTLGDYLIRVITECEPICHPTNAAATGLYSLEKEDWNKEYIQLLVGGQIVFPRIGQDEIIYKAGKISYRVKPAIGDQQAALLGSGFRKSTDLSFNIGTGAQVSRVIKNIEFGNYQVRPYFFDSYIKTIPHIPAGRALNVYYRFFKSILELIDPVIDDGKIWEMMKKVVNTELVKMTENSVQCDLSFFENAITNNKVGCIENIGECNFTFETLVNSVFYEMADNFVTMARRLDSDKGSPVDAIIFSGGMSKQWDVLRNLIVKEFPIDTLVILSENDTLHGCCYYALMENEDEGILW
ncbi:Sugar (pentulose or hexulose) kinase [Lachnospiraceae bacterium XBB1006]|nr:Sugar (pentulose or hexulose) kinase [Lachnospiraceae bacterium XBB1006]